MATITVAVPDEFAPMFRRLVKKFRDAVARVEEARAELTPDDKFEVVLCENCHGCGEIHCHYNYQRGLPHTTQRCRECGGRGRLYLCRRCRTTTRAKRCHECGAGVTDPPAWAAYRRVEEVTQ